MGAGSRHALGRLKYYYYEIDGAWGEGGGEEHEMNYTAGGGKGGSGDGGRDGSRHALGMLKYYDRAWGGGGA